jgi:hypothetical protein
MNRFVILCCAAALSALLGCKDQKLVDDLQWMDNTYNPHEGVSGSHGHGKTGWYNRVEHGSDVLASGNIQTFKSDGCSFELHGEDNPEDLVHKKLVNKWQFNFSLHDLDPDSMKVKTYSHYGGFDCEEMGTEALESTGNKCDYAELTIVTRNSAPLVKEVWQSTYPNLTGNDHQSASTKKATEVWFVIDDVEYAKKFADVLKDAIKRCGGTRGAAS